MKTEFEFIHFDDISNPTKKTKEWGCRNNKRGGCLGFVKWNGGWRQYCFFPTDALFSAGCLRDIATFIESVKGERNPA